MLRDSACCHWAASHSLDADDGMRKTMRISIALYREEMLPAAEIMPAQMAGQLEMIEQQREQLGEEHYQQMKQGMEATAGYRKAIVDSARHPPGPSAFVAAHNRADDRRTRYARASKIASCDFVNLASVPISSLSTRKAAPQQGESGFFLMAGRGERI